MYRLFLIAVLLVILYYLIRRAIRKIGQGGALEKPMDRGPGNQMVQDPVCRVFVPRENAVKEQIGGQTYYFCSRGCATAFEKQLSS